MKPIAAKGAAASRLRQRKHEILRFFNIPEDGLPGSLVLTHRRCGKAGCHCAEEEKGHPIWSLTFMVDGKKRVEWIPNQWISEVLPLVEAGRAYKEAVAEVFAINAQLLALCRQQRSGGAARKRKKR